MNLGRYLRSLRVNRGMMQKQLAAEIGVLPSYLSSLENGARIYIGDQMLTRFCKALRLTDEEMEQILALRGISSGKLPGLREASDDEAELIGLIVRHVGAMKPDQVRATTKYLQAWFEATGVVMGDQPREEKRIA